MDFELWFSLLISIVFFLRGCKSGDKSGKEGLKNHWSSLGWRLLSEDLKILHVTVVAGLPLEAQM